MPQPEAAPSKRPSGGSEGKVHMVRLFLPATVAAGLALGLSGTSVAAKCLTANAEDQIAEGRLTVGSGKDAAGRSQKPYLLRMPAPACLNGADPEDRVKGSRIIHVYPANEKLGRDFRRFVGKTVLVRGNPFPRHTMHHRAPIVMEVTEIDTP